MAKMFASLCSLLALCAVTINSHEIERNIDVLKNNNSSYANVTYSTVDDYDLTRNTSVITRITSSNVASSLLVQPSSKPTELAKLLDLWNPMVLSNVWKDSRDFRLTDKCEKDFSRFLNGLTLGKSWAVKMLDASGRHTWGIFSGSRYWIGASDQCRQMDHDFFELSKLNQSQRDDNETRLDIPPFRVSVNSVRLWLDILQSGINGTHDITVGVCVPSSCRPGDIAELFHYSTNGLYPDLPRRVTIDHVRNLSDGYDLWDDPIFYVILISFVIAILLVILGTLYDVALRYRILSQEITIASNEIIGNAGESTEGFVTSMKVTSGDFNEEITISRIWSIKRHNGSLDVWNAKDVPKPMSEALLSFSLLLNISKLASLDVGNDTLAPIHGLRFLSILWIIMVHTCLMANEVSDNKMFRSSAEQDFLYQTISNGTYAVDTFFFISGCLVSFLYFRTITKQRIKEKKIIQGFIGKIMQFIGMMSYRYFRLTPPYLLVIGLIQISMKWYHDHSIIELTTLDHRNCEKFWWRNALYVNTYFDMDDRCMVWSWYLANDTQFYTIGIIILIIAASFVSAGALIGFAVLIASWFTTAIITLNTKHIPTIEEPFAHYESLYDKPWTRIGPYLIGMTVGWYLCRIECKLKLNKVTIVLGWIVSIVTLLSIVYGLYGNNFDPITSALYTALSHSGWAISLGFILIACVTGNGGGANKILSWKYIYPLSRLTYCAYLVHPALMRSMILRGESSFHLTQGFVAIIFFGITIASYAVSLFLSLLFEAPMVSLLRIVHPLRQWKQD